MEFYLSATKTIEVEYKTVITASDKESALRELESKLECCPKEIEIDKTSSVSLEYDNDQWWELKTDE